MAEVGSGETEPEKTQQNIELSEKDQTQKQTEEKNNTSSTPKEAKTKSMKLKLRFPIKFISCFTVFVDSIFLLYFS